MTKNFVAYKTMDYMVNKTPSPRISARNLESNFHIHKMIN